MQFIRERRAAPRIKIFQPVELALRDTRLRAHLLNISTSGALIYARTRVARGERVSLRCSFDLGAARVIWSDGTRIGALFEQPLSQRQLDTLIADLERSADAFARRIDAAMA
jgi:hypothetical protein